MPGSILMTTPLQDYINTGSPEAFRQIVETHLNAVYSQCRRQLRDADRAEEATQIVFVTLARRVRELRPGVLLGGWLFNTARYVCSRERRTERRRLTRERKAAEMRHETIEQTSRSSSDLRAEAEGLLDDALAKLSERDRAVILCRFFDGRSLRDVGAQLGVSEDAAKQRVSRAVEKLRTYFARNGLAIPSSAVTASLSMAVQPASPGLLDSVISAAIHGDPPIQPLHRAPKIINSAAKVAATTLAIAGLITAAIVVTKHAPAANPLATAPLTSPAIPSTAPSSEPLNQSTPEAALRKLSTAIREDNVDDIEACVSFADHSNQEIGDAIRTTFLYSAAVCRIDRAWMTAFGTHMKIEGFELTTFPGLHGGYEEIVDRTLSNLKPGDVTIDGQTATIRVHVPRKEMAEFGQVAWADASLVMRRQGNDWQLDAPASIRLEILLEPQPRDPRQTLIQINTEACATLRQAADAIETGQIKTPKQASDQIHAELWKSLHEAKLTNIAIHNLPSRVLY
jgi:RNA polymerase sigma factor (sigma-70 family)